MAVNFPLLACRMNAEGSGRCWQPGLGTVQKALRPVCVQEDAPGTAVATRHAHVLWMQHDLSTSAQNHVRYRCERSRTSDAKNPA